ncbi:hypothetical protein O7623_11235 [Solwaraspora sp. WMMD791]|uniref:hypothetical protein n=1 Tax=Solwaraspora sp. WMMD791 TaxID=3016086 RepID=UPI00249ACEC9|nr:hypothetical protein [Solwaraspora sp. WMMD791]WFE29717.1 hypothetical protein O7623_11235 [Solwaraspora sp. WMMD791]
MPLIGHGPAVPIDNRLRVPPDTRWRDAGWLAAAADVEQHRIEGRCPACDLDGCEVLTAAELIVATAADPAMLPHH